MHSNKFRLGGSLTETETESEGDRQTRGERARELDNQIVRGREQTRGERES